MFSRDRDRKNIEYLYDNLNNKLNELSARIVDFEKARQEDLDVALLKSKGWTTKETTAWHPLWGSTMVARWYPPAKSCLTKEGRTREDAAKLARETK